MRLLPILFCLALTAGLIGCGEGAHEFNQTLVSLRDQARQDTSDVIAKLQAFDGSEAEGKAIDESYAKLLKSVEKVKSELAKVEVPSGVENSQEMYDAVKTFMDGIESMLKEDWAVIIPLIKEAKLAQGAERADLYAELRLQAGKLQAKSQAIDTAMRDAQAAFAKANKIRLEN